MKSIMRTAFLHLILVQTNLDLSFILFITQQMKPRKIAQQLTKMHFMPIEIKSECALISILSESDFMFYHHASISKSDDCMCKQYIL